MFSTWLLLREREQESTKRKLEQDDYKTCLKQILPTSKRILNGTSRVLEARRH